MNVTDVYIEQWTTPQGFTVRGRGELRGVGLKAAKEPCSYLFPHIRIRRVTSKLEDVDGNGVELAKHEEKIGDHISDKERLSVVPRLRASRQERQEHYSSLGRHDDYSQSGMNVAGPMLMASSWRVDFGGDCLQKSQPAVKL